MQQNEKPVATPRDKLDGRKKKVINPEEGYDETLGGFIVPDNEEDDDYFEEEVSEDEEFENQNNIKNEQKKRKLNNATTKPQQKQQQSTEKTPKPPLKWTTLMEEYLLDEIAGTKAVGKNYIGIFSHLSFIFSYHISHFSVLANKLSACDIPVTAEKVKTKIFCDRFKPRLEKKIAESESQLIASNGMS